MDMVIIILLIVVIILLIGSFLRKPITNRAELIKIEERLIRIEGELDKLLPNLDNAFRSNRREIADNLQSIGRTLDTRVRSLQDDNSKKLEEMRLTVDEKLQRSVEQRFNESFKSISGQLAQVYRGLGEMKTLANGVGDLRKVMEGVKTRGIYGEVQLGNLIADCMSQEQYVENVVTKAGSNERVEFAIKMPGKDEREVYLPIDSKFPVENYARLIEAYDSGDKNTIDGYRKALKNDVLVQAKKIANKYLDPPVTTDFGVMFVPTESLYAEILRIPGLSDEVRQRLQPYATYCHTQPEAVSSTLKPRAKI